jgi:hypothetical protein
VTRPPRNGGRPVSKRSSRKTEKRSLRRAPRFARTESQLLSRESAGQRSASAMIATIKLIMVNQDIAAISSSTLVLIATRLLRGFCLKRSSECSASGSVASNPEHYPVPFLGLHSALRTRLSWWRSAASETRWCTRVRHRRSRPSRR